MRIRVEAPDRAVAERLARELARCGEVETAPVDETRWQVSLSSALDEGQVTLYAFGVVTGLLRSGGLVTARVRVGSPGDTVDALCELRPGSRGGRRPGTLLAASPSTALASPA